MTDRPTPIPGAPPSAPFGHDEQGHVIAPYGIRKDGTPARGAGGYPRGKKRTDIVTRVGKKLLRQIDKMSQAELEQLKEDDPSTFWGVLKKALPSMRAPEPEPLDAVTEIRVIREPESASSLTPARLAAILKSADPTDPGRRRLDAAIESMAVERAGVLAREMNAELAARVDALEREKVERLQDLFVEGAPPGESLDHPTDDGPPPGGAA